MCEMYMQTMSSDAVHLCHFLSEANIGHGEIAVILPKVVLWHIYRSARTVGHFLSSSFVSCFTSPVNSYSSKEQSSASCNPLGLQSHPANSSQIDAAYLSLKMALCCDKTLSCQMEIGSSSNQEAPNVWNSCILQFKHLPYAFPYVF